MRKFVLVVAALSGIALIASTSRSDDLGSTTEAPPSVDLSFPATGPMVSNAPHDPSVAPYDIGPPGSAWTYEQLSDADKAVVDRGREPAGSQADIDAYNAAMLHLAEQAKADMAARMLGINELGYIGVVP